MKKNKVQYVLALMLFSTMFVASCNKNGDTVPSTSFEGTWFNNEFSTVNGSAAYPLAIESPDASNILFSFLYGFQTKVEANVVNNSFTIPSQIIEGNDVSGAGTLVSTTQINMSYVVNNGLFIDSVSVILTK